MSYSAKEEVLKKSGTLGSALTVMELQDSKGSDDIFPCSVEVKMGEFSKEHKLPPFCRQFRNHWQNVSNGFLYNTNGRDWRQIYGSSPYEHLGITPGIAFVCNLILSLALCTTSLTNAINQSITYGFLSYFVMMTHWLVVSTGISSFLLTYLSFRAFLSFRAPIYEETDEEKIPSRWNILATPGYEQLRNSPEYARDGTIFVPNPTNPQTRVSRPMRKDLTTWQAFKHQFVGPFASEAAVQSCEVTRDGQEPTWYTSVPLLCAFSQIMHMITVNMFFVVSPTFWLILVPMGCEVDGARDIWNHGIASVVYSIHLVLNKAPYFSNVYIHWLIAGCFYVLLSFIVFWTNATIYRVDGTVQGYIYSVIDFNTAPGFACLFIFYEVFLMGSIGYIFFWKLQRKRTFELEKRLYNHPSSSTSCSTENA